MALALPISLSMPVTTAKFSLKELRPRKAPLAILSSLATVRTESNLLLHCYSTREILPKGNHHGHLAPLYHFGYEDRYRDSMVGA